MHGDELAPKDEAPPPYYFETYFQVAAPADGLPDRFGIITAYNPFNGEVPAAENRRANAELERTLVEDRRGYFRVTGACIDGSHCEPGFGVAADSPADIRAYARRFAQAGFYWVENDVLYVLNTESPTLHRVDFWAARRV